jgi:hypothetical protein
MEVTVACDWHFLQTIADLPGLNCARQNMAVNVMIVIAVIFLKVLMIFRF